MNLLRSLLLLRMLLLVTVLFAVLAGKSSSFSPTTPPPAFFVHSDHSVNNHLSPIRSCCTSHCAAAHLCYSSTSPSSFSAKQRTRHMIVCSAQPSDNSEIEEQGTLGTSTNEKTTKRSPEEDEQEEEEPGKSKKEKQQQSPPNIIKQSSPDQSEPIRDFYQKQEDADRKLMNRLLLPQRIGQFFNTLAIAFILAGILLNLAGYDFVVRDGKVGIDTIEARQFRDEVNRSSSRRGGGNNDNP